LTGQLDAVELAQALIRCPSVTPEDGGALARLTAALEGLGLQCHSLPFGEYGTAEVQNLYARIGSAAPNFCFAGHTDVVPVGAPVGVPGGWTRDPFGAEIEDGILYGRGASDMKSAIAAFTAATSRFLDRRGADFGGSISLLITGDEEGPSVNGTRKVLEWLEARGEKLDACVVGEPTNPASLGDMVKIGRRGSLTGRLTVTGIQGHSAYPDLADNPLPRMIRMLAAISEPRLDDGTDHFQPSNLQLTTIDVGNPATNITPAAAHAGFNLRFNDLHTGAELTEWLHARLSEVGGDYDLSISISGEAFLTPPGPLSGLMSDAIESVTGNRPELSTSGGTSDARFIKDYAAVAEFGLISKTMHKADEEVALEDIEKLSAIYEAVLDGYFPP